MILIKCLIIGIGNKRNPLHFLVIHGSLGVKNPPDFKLESVKYWFDSSDSGRVEGIVWHCPSGALYKVSVKLYYHNSIGNCYVGPDIMLKDSCICYDCAMDQYC